METHEIRIILYLIALGLTGVAAVKGYFSLAIKFRGRYVSRLERFMAYTSLGILVVSLWFLLGYAKVDCAVEYKLLIGVIGILIGLAVGKYQWNKTVKKQPLSRQMRRHLK